MRAAALALLLSTAPALAQVPTPQAVVTACISLTEAAIASAEGPRRARLEADLDLMHKALRGLDALGDSAAKLAPQVGRLPSRLEDCVDDV